MPQEIKKFRYITFDLVELELKGTDSDDVSAMAAASGDFLVYDTRTGQWLHEEGNIPLDELYIDSDDSTAAEDDDD